MLAKQTIKKQLVGNSLTNLIRFSKPYKVFIANPTRFSKPYKVFIANPTRFSKPCRVFGSFFFFCFLFWASPTFATPQTDTLTNDLFVYSLEDEWAVYDKYSNAYLPYFANLYPKVNKLHTKIDKPAYQGLYLNVLGDSLATLFIDQKLCYVFNTKKWHSMPIDSLLNEHHASNLWLTYYQKENFSQQPEAYLSVQPYKTNLVTLNTADNSSTAHQVALRPIEQLRKNRIGISSLLLLSIVALMSSLHTPLFKWSLIVKNFTNFIQARNQIKRLQGTQFFWYTIYYSLTLAFVVSLLQNQPHHLIDSLQFSTFKNIWQQTANLFLLFLLLVLAVLAKYLAIWLMTQLYNNRQLQNLHFQEFITISQIICSAILFTALLLSTFPVYAYSVPIFLKYSILVLLFLQTCLISYRIKQSISYSWIYFFAYLFSTEFVPFLLYVKIFIPL